MADSVAFANKGTITIKGLAGTYGGAYPTIVTLGVVKDVEIVVSAEHVPLYGWGTAKRVAVCKHSIKVPVKIGFMKLDPVYTAGFPFYILNPSAVTTASGTIEDTHPNDVKLFEVTANFLFESGVNLKGTVSNVFFPDFPLRASEGQWMKVDMSGEGSDIVFTNP